MESESKISCERIGSIIIEYIDGELDSDAAALVARHICECADCRKLYNDMKAVCRAAGDCAYDPPEALRPGVMCALRRERSAFRLIKIKKISAFAGVAAAAVVCLGIGMTALLTGLEKFGADGDKSAPPLLEGSCRLAEAMDNNSSGLMNFRRHYSMSDGMAEKENYDADRNESGDGLKFTTDPDAINGGEETCPSCTVGHEAPAASPDGTAATASIYSRLAGDWTLPAENGMIHLTLRQDGGYSLTDSYGIVTEGCYNASEEAMVFIFYHPNGEDGYYFTLTDDNLIMTPISGAGLLR